MKQIRIIIWATIFLIITLGAIDTLGSGLKDEGYWLLGGSSGISIFAFAVFGGNKWIAAFSIAFVLFLFAPALLLFLTSIVNPPIEMLADCEGHRVMSYHGIIEFFVAIPIALLAGYLVFRMKAPSQTLRWAFGALAITAIVLSLIKVPILQSADHYMDEVKQPKMVLPDGCE